MGIQKGGVGTYFGGRFAEDSGWMDTPPDIGPKYLKMSYSSPLSNFYEKSFKIMANEH